MLFIYFNASDNFFLSIKPSFFIPKYSVHASFISFFSSVKLNKGSAINTQSIYSANCFNISFQLSVLSTLAIVWVVPFYFQLIINKFKIKSRILKVFLSAVLVSVFAMIFTMPVAVKEFGYASLISPVTNLLITYAVTLALVLNITGLVLSVIPILNILSNCVFGAAKIFASYTVFIINSISKIPVTIAILPQNSYLIFTAVVFAIIAFMYFYNFSKKRRDF